MILLKSDPAYVAAICLKSSIDQVFTNKKIENLLIKKYQFYEVIMKTHSDDNLSISQYEMIICDKIIPILKQYFSIVYNSNYLGYKVTKLT